LIPNHVSHCIPKSLFHLLTCDDGCVRDNFHQQDYPISFGCAFELNFSATMIIL
jgi:hypothetical protein